MKTKERSQERKGYIYSFSPPVRTTARAETSGQLMHEMVFRAGKLIGIGFGAYTFRLRRDGVLYRFDLPFSKLNIIEMKYFDGVGKRPNMVRCEVPAIFSRPPVSIVEF